MMQAIQSDFFTKPTDELNYDKQLAELLTSTVSDSLGNLRNCALGKIKDFQTLAKLLSYIHCDKIFKEKLQEIKKSESVELKYGIGKEKATILSPKDHKLLVLMALTQKAMLRPSNIERKDMDDPKDFQGETREKLVKLFDQLGLHQEYKPLIQQDLETAIIGSAFAFRFIPRFLYALFLIKEKKISCVYINAGKRILDDLTTQNGRDIGATIQWFPECKDIIIQLVKEGALRTELDLSRFIVEQLKIKNPENFEGFEIIYSEALPKPGDMRARTDDSVGEVEKKLNKGIPANKIVIISNNPYIGYQYETYLGKMREDNLQVAGPQATDDCPILDYFDSLTRLFFTTALRMLCTHYKLEYADAQLIASEYVNNVSSYKDITSLITAAYVPKPVVLAT